MTEVTAVIPTGHTNARSLSDWLGTEVTLFTGFADAGSDTQILQAAINAAAAGLASWPQTRAAVVQLPPGQISPGPITLKDRVILRGAGKAATEIKAPNNLVGIWLASENFAALTASGGMNKWDAADGVRSLIGVQNLRINGNKAGGADVAGLSLYAKGLVNDDLLIVDCKRHGIYSEAGYGAGVSSWPTIPEGRTGWVEITSCDLGGWLMRGPHDLYGGKLLCVLNGGFGLKMESLSAHYLATADFDMIHSYANQLANVHILRSELRVGRCRAENGQAEGLLIEDSSDCMFGELHLFDNCKVSGDFQGVVNIGSKHISVGSARVRSPGRAAAGGISWGGDNCILTADISGASASFVSTGVGLDVPSDSSHHQISAVIDGFSGAGGMALRTGRGGACRHNKVSAVLQYSSTLWNNETAGAGNRYDITGECASTQIMFTGAAPRTTNPNCERWNVTLSDSAGAFYNVGP